PPSALTISSAVIGVFGESGGVSIETFRMNSLPERETQSASLVRRSDCSTDVPEQPAMMGASTSSASNGFRLIVALPTLNQAPALPLGLGPEVGPNSLFCHAFFPRTQVLTRT